jgi:hypothetical protein
MVYKVLKNFARTGHILFSGDKNQSHQKLRENGKTRKSDNALSAGRFRRATDNSAINTCPLSVDGRTEISDDVPPIYFSDGSKTSDLFAYDIARTVYEKRHGGLPTHAKQCSPVIRDPFVQEQLAIASRHSL